MISSNMNPSFTPYQSVGGQTVTGSSANGLVTSGGAVLSPFTGQASQTNQAPASTSPVITANAAQKDLDAKTANYQSLVSSVSQQKSLLAQQAAQKAADDAQKQVQSAQTAMDQQKIAIQKQTADAATTEAQTKQQAVALANTPDGTTSAPTGTNSTTATPAPQGDTPTDNPTQDSLNSALSTEQGGLADIQTTKDSVTQQSNAALNSLLSGTIPLSGPQQSLILSLQNQLTQNEANQTQANNAYTGAVTESGFRSGGEYTSDEYAGQIQGAVSVGVQKIQALDNSAASTMAQLEQSFQKDDFDAINQQYDNLTKSLNDKAAAITDTYNTVTKAIQDQRDAQATAAKTAFDENLQSENFDLTKSQDQIDNMFKQGQITETERHDMADEANQRAQTSIDQDKEKIADSEFNISYGQFVNSDGTPNTNIDPTKIQGYTQLPNGTSVISNVNGVYKTSSVGGIPVATPDAIKTVTVAAGQANTISKMQGLYTQAINSGSGTAKDQYNALYATLPPNIQSMLPTTGGILKNMSGDNDKFSAAYSALNQTISSAVPNASTPPYGQVFTDPASAQSYFTQTGQTTEYQSEVDKANQLAQQYYGRNANDGEILQIINGQ